MTVRQQKGAWVMADLDEDSRGTYSHDADRLEFERAWITFAQRYADGPDFWLTVFATAVELGYLVPADDGGEE